ncbi:unnamed protein product [Periconia digitata]|uniref:Uncharacterized protein n=1 Tax=Periconia digitata TaxID=1303443 RepID=A0A9W4UVB8_9PLEO|nr:unnamed protein product [Periconia digitata]
MTWPSCQSLFFHVSSELHHTLFSQSSEYSDTTGIPACMHDIRIPELWAVGLDQSGLHMYMYVPVLDSTLTHSRLLGCMERRLVRLRCRLHSISCTPSFHCPVPESTPSEFIMTSETIPTFFDTSLECVSLDRVSV